MEDAPRIDEQSPASPDETVIKDEAYWAEVREAVGRGTPSILMGTSSHALDRAVARIIAAQQTALPQGESTES